MYLNKKLLFVFLFEGNEDTFCTLESIVKSTEYCDNFVLKIIEGAGHWPHQQMADEFNKVVLKFLVGKYRILYLFLSVFIFIY